MNENQIRRLTERDITLDSLLSVIHPQIRVYHCSVADNDYMTRKGMNYIWIILKKKDKTKLTMHFSRSSGV